MLTKRTLPARRGAFAPFETLREGMDHLFNQWLGEMEEVPMGFNPRIDFMETDKGLVLTAELPGLEEKDVEVELTRNVLRIKGEKEVGTEEKGESFFRRERSYGLFAREVTLPWEVDPEKVHAEATFKHGVLTVHVPRPVGMKSETKKIAVTAS